MNNDLQQYAVTLGITVMNTGGDHNWLHAHMAGQTLLLTAPGGHSNPASLDDAAAVDIYHADMEGQELHTIPFDTARAALDFMHAMQQPVTCSADIKPLLKAYYTGATVPTAVVLYLSLDMRIMAIETLTKGAPLRTVAARVFELDAAFLVLANNDKAGLISQGDISLAVRFKDTFERLGTRLLDVLAVGTKRTQSMAERGML